MERFMMLQGLNPEFLVRLLNLDRPGDDDSWLLFGPEMSAAEEDEHAPVFRWAAE